MNGVFDSARMGGFPLIAVSCPNLFIISCPVSITILVWRALQGIQFFLVGKALLSKSIKTTEDIPRFYLISCKME
jgi:regulator of sirC expression with transglutaminase-like and TPR domain